MKPTPEISAAAAALGRLGGNVGGRRRAESLSPERRSAIASLAARARWAKTNAAQRARWARPIAAEPIVKKTGPEVMHLHPRRGIYSRKKKPHIGHCDICGRVDLESVGCFHYSPDPCGLPCAGGPKVIKREDRLDGVHSTKDCPKCSG